MAGCKVTAGFANVCADLLKVSGLGKRFWIGYKADLDTQIAITQAADINAIDFASYGVLYAFEGSKFAHDYTWELAVATGGNKSFNQTLNIKLSASSTAEDVILQQLLMGDDIFAIVEDLNREFFIMGAGNGMISNAATGGSGGKENGGDSSSSITLIANEKTIPLRFQLGGGYDASLAYLISRQA